MGTEAGNSCALFSRRAAELFGVEPQYEWGLAIGAARPIAGMVLHQFTWGGNLKQLRGFASLSPEERREISALGGETGSGHKWSSETASLAGAKGALGMKRRAALRRSQGKPAQNALRVKHGPRCRGPWKPISEWGRAQQARTLATQLSLEPKRK